MDHDKNYIKEIALFLFIANILLVLIGNFGVGNNIWQFLIGNGRFGDFNIDIIFDVVRTHPRPNDSGQFPAFDIVYAKLFDPYKYLLLISNVVLGILLPLFLIYRFIPKKSGKGRCLILLLVTSYPFVFAFFRANPILGSVLWCFFGVLCFLKNYNRRAIFSITFASLIHPTAGIFCLIFIRNGWINFLYAISLVIGLQLFFYFLIDYDLFLTLDNQISSLKHYKIDYVFGNYGDLYNNSLFVLAKALFYKNLNFLELVLTFIPFILMIIIILRGLSIIKHYGFKSFCNLFAVYYLPIWVILSTGVAADYRLLYLSIPIIFMISYNCYNYSLGLLLIAILPKHFIFFSSYWLSLHPDALFTFPNLSAFTGVGITLNSILNPAILLIALFLSTDLLAKNLSELLLIHPE